MNLRNTYFSSKLYKALPDGTYEYRRDAAIVHIPTLLEEMKPREITD